MEEEKENINFNKIPGKDIYQAPEGYFETLPGKILQRIEEDEKGGEEKPTIQIGWKTIGYAAAASILLLVAVLIGIQSSKNDAASPESLLAEVSTSDLILYLQYSEIDTYEIIEVTDMDYLEQSFDDEEGFIEPQLDDADMDMLYEQYGISPDENLQMF